MLVSASTSPEAKQQHATANSFRKPFQSILLLAPSKHNHLFSALPKTLFGRLLSSSPPASTSSSTTPSTISSNLAKGKSNLALPNIAGPTSQLSHPAWTGSSRDLEQLGLQHLDQLLRHQIQHQQNYLTQQQIRHLPISLPKKHALGLGESDEFMIVDPSANQMTGEQMSNQDQYTQSSALQYHTRYLQQQQHLQQQQQQPAKEEYQEIPAIVISDQEQEQHSRPVASPAPFNTSQMAQSHLTQAQDLSNYAQLSLEFNKNNSSSEPQIDPSRLMNGTQPTAISNSERESALKEKENGRKSGQESATQVTAEPEVEVSPSQQSTISSSSNLTVSDNDANNMKSSSGDNSNSSSNVLTTLISDELGKLKQEPEVLNKTLSSMSQPVVALFLDGSGGFNYENTSRNGNSDKQATPNDQEYQQQQVAKQQVAPSPSTLENGSENGDLDSSAAAIIVSPAGDAGSSMDDSRALGDQLAALSDEQIESFIIGPYKGLTSDNVQQMSPSEHHHQFRDPTSSPQQLLANFQATQQQLRTAQPQQLHFLRPQQSHVGLGMSSMASNLIQQAKSLIHLPFAHLASNQMATTNHIPTMFRGQPKYPHSMVSMSASGGRHLLGARPDGMIDQSSSPSTFHMPKGTPLAPALKPLYEGSLSKQQAALVGGGVQMMPQEQGNYRYHQRQQQNRRPSYNKHQNVNVWSPNSATNALGLSTGNPMLYGQNSATSSLKPIQQQQQPFGMQHNGVSRYFVRRPGANTKQLQAGNLVQSVEEKQSKSSVPYFVENPNPARQQQQQHPMDRELVQLGASQSNKFGLDDNSTNNNNLQYQTTEPNARQQQVGAKSHPLNDIAASSRQTVQQNDFHFVVNHGGQGDAGQVGLQPTPSVFFEQQQQQQQRQQQHPANEASSGQSKFKSGLYQIDPPRLTADGSSQEQQEHVSIPDGESESAADEDEQQQQHLSAEQQTDQQRHLLAGSEPQSSQDIEEEDSEQQESDTMRDSNDNSIAQDFARQVGATIGVGTARNKTRKGLVFSEPINGGELASRQRNQEYQRPRGKNLTQIKKLKHTQDITLYDFEVPQRQQQQASNSQQKQVAQQVNYLDTQVYTIPYTLSVQSQAGNGAPVYSATPSVSASYQTTSFHQPAAPSLKQHQPRPQPPFSPYTQIGRFPLPYFPPPAPQAAPPQTLREIVAPAQQKQQQQPQYLASNHQVQHIANNMPLISHEQTALRAQNQDFGDNSWRSNQALAAHQNQGLMRQQSPTNRDQLHLTTNSFEQAAQISGNNNRQHYFHYQPVASLNQALNQEQQQQQNSLQANGVGQLSSEQPVYDYPTASTQMPTEQQQFMLAISHQADQATPNGASLFSSNFIRLPQQQQPQQVALNQATEVNQINEITSPNVSHQDSRTETPESLGQVATASSSGPSVAKETEAQKASTSQRQNEGREQSINGEIESREPEREQPQLVSQSSSSGQISSPSAFCADRAPGLYADESQRCKVSLT